MSNSMGGIKSFIKNVVHQKPWLQDPLAVKKPWNEEEYRLVEHGDGKSLCFGIIWDDENVVPHPPIIRALEKTKAALLSAGHQGEKCLVVLMIIHRFHPQLLTGNH